MQHKIISDEQLIELMEENLNLPQMFERLNGAISKVAIHKRIKRLEKRLQPLPDSFQKLTQKQQQFVSNVVAGDNQTTAALKAFDCQDRKSAAVIATRLMHDPDLNEAITSLMAQAGIGKRQRIEKMSEYIHGRDSAASCRMLELSFKLDRSLVDQIEHSVSIESIRALMALIPDQQPVIDVTPE